MKEIKGWLSNAIFAVLAAIFGVMQEVWLGTEPNFLTFFALSASCAICGAVWGAVYCLI